jgi:uncharacterized membrane protein
MKRILTLFSFFVFFYNSLTAQAAAPIVRAVLFYSPTCGHCHFVMTETLPALREKYGEQLQILEIDATVEAGGTLYWAAIAAYQIDRNRVGVPALIVADQFLVGSDEIPEQFPGIIESLLAQNGSDWPNIPGLEVALAQQGFTQEEPQLEAGWQARFMKDPLANGIAVAVLAGMIASLTASAGMVIFSWKAPRRVESWPGWIIPLVCILGLGVAGYLTYVESTASQAVCGPVGDCNAVQSSPYAKVLGFLPVGLLGMIGYGGIILAWAIRATTSGRVKNLSILAMWGMALFGVLFSSYLTFLEPFVIGATCVWCIASALLITALLWATTPGAKIALADAASSDEDFSEDEE